MAVVEGKAVVSIDGAQAGQQLDLLEKKTLELRRALVDLKSQTVLDNKKIKETEKELSLTRKEMQALKLATKDYSTTLKNLSGASLRELEAAARQLSRETRNLKRDTDEYKRAAGDLSRVKAEMAKVRQEMNAAGVQTKTFGSKLREVGSYMFAGGGIIAAFTFLVSVVRNAFQTITEFGKKVSELQAITGASGADLDFLKNKAKDLAAQYGKSASEIVEAMKMVGSAKPELLENVDALSQVTEAVLTLSQASGMDLATSTSSLTTIMNQFGHSASMANEDINILAAGSKFGAVEVDYLAESISKVGTIAAAAGLNLEQTTAVMELFGEKGVKAETAGRGFKTILTELQKDTKNYTNGVFDLNKAIDNNQSIAGDNLKLQKKFGTEFFGLAQILFQNKERFLELNKQVTGTNTAFEQAAIATDNLSGDLEKAAGAWDKFVLGLEDGDGAISTVLRGVVQGFSSLLGLLGKINDSGTSTKERFESWAKVLTFINPVLAITNAAMGKLVGLWDKLFGEEQTTAKKKNLIGIFDGEAMIKQTQMMQEQLKIAEELKKKAAEEGAQLTEDEIEANKKKNDEILRSNKDLVEKIKRMQIELLEDEQKRDEAELQMWYDKEAEIIETSTASKQVRDEALEVLEILHQEKMQEILDKYLALDLERINKLNEAEKNRREGDTLKIGKSRKTKTTEDVSGALAAGAKAGGQIQLGEDELIALQESLAATDMLFQSIADEKIKRAQDSAAREIEILKNQKAQELKILENALRQGFISEEQYQKKKDALDVEYAEKEAKVEEDLELKKKDIAKRFADVQFAVKAASIIANTAEAIMKALATLGPIAGPIAAGAMGLQGAIQLGVANAERQRIKGLAGGGRFGVTRSQDGKRFNASYGGSGSGYYSKPTVLVAEEGEEFVVSNRALKVPAFKRAVDAIDTYQRGKSFSHLNYSGLINSMNNVKGFADGGYTENNGATSQNVSADMSMAILEELRAFRADLTTWQTNLEVYVEIQKIRDAEETLSTIETDVTL